MHLAMTCGNKEYTLFLFLVSPYRQQGKENTWIVLHHIQLLRLRRKKTTWLPIHTSPIKTNQSTKKWAAPNLKDMI